MHYQMNWLGSESADTSDTTSSVSSSEEDWDELLFSTADASNFVSVAVGGMDNLKLLLHLLMLCSTSSGTLFMHTCCP